MIDHQHEAYLAGVEAGEASIVEERDKWIQAFNRLEGAVSHHIGAKAEAFKDEADEALHKAHKQILKDLAK